MAKYLILGTGAFAREVYWHILGASGPETEILFADDHSDAREIRFGENIHCPVIKDWHLPSGWTQEGDFSGFIVGTGSARIKKEFVSRALEAQIPAAKTIIHPRALIQGSDCRIGKGGVITPGCVLTTNVRIGDYVVLNLNCTVGHDTIIEDFVTCNPGCNISGSVHIKSGCLIGTGAVIREKTTITNDVTIGAQSCVVKNINEAGITMAGVPAKVLQK